MSLSVKSLFAPRPQPISDAAAERRAAARKQMKSRYRVDLINQQAQCEFNYYLLHKLLHDLAVNNEWRFELGEAGRQQTIKVIVSDRAPYTTTLQLSQLAAAVPDSSAMSNLNMTVCLYHDASMAEVVAWDTHKRIRPRYEYPNTKMYQKNEKVQHNLFLTEWLTLCQSNGRSSFDVRTLIKE